MNRGERLHIVKLGLCQVHTEPWDVQGNFERTLAALEAVADAGAELAITPECVLHGYAAAEDRRETLRRYAEVSEPLGGGRLAAVGDLARRRRMHVVLGFLERGEGKEAGQYYNASAIFSAAGERVAVYRKVHCRDFERIGGAGGGGYTPGERFVVADLPAGERSLRLGAMICFDREVTESVRCLRALGAELVACPLACDTERLDQHLDRAHNEMITRCRAAENELYIAVVNHAGRFNGGSFVVGPGGEALVQLGGGAEVAVVDVKLPIAQRGRPLGWMGWGYRRPEVYERHLGQ